MACNNANLRESPLKAPAIEIVDLISDNGSSEETLAHCLEHDTRSSRRVEEDESEDDDDWSIYEDALDAMDDQDPSPGGIFIYVATHLLKMLRTSNS